MSLKDTLICGARGAVDSLKGIYWLYTLDNAQRRAHAERLEFKELGRKGRNPKIPKPSASPKHHHNKEEPRLLNRVLQCCTLNGLVFGLSIILFNHVLLPLLQSLISLMSSSSNSFWYWLQCLLQWTFGSLWVLPLFLLSRIVNALWFQDIGTLAYRYSVGRPKSLSFSTLLADTLFSCIIEALFLIQGFVLEAAVPYILGPTISTLIFLMHTCLLYSLYSFEYKWVQMGVSLHQRIMYLESNWPYFLGFGLPLSLLTYWPNDFVVSGCFFAIFFPIFIIAGNEADVVTYNG